MPAKLWIDVEDLFEYVRGHARPSGIQRTAFEIARELQQRYGPTGRIHFVRHVPTSNSFRIVGWPEIARLYATLTDAPTPASRLRGTLFSPGPGRQRLRRLVQRLPTSLRLLVTEVVLTTAIAGHAWSRLFASLFRGALRLPGQLVRGQQDRRRLARVRDSDRSARPLPGDGAGTAVSSSIDFPKAASRDDVLLVFGAPWFHPDYAGLIRANCSRYGLRFAMLIHDIIPIRRPEWFERGLVRVFIGWFVPMLPLCDRVFTVSRATAADLEAYILECDVAMRGKVLALPMGTEGFSGLLSRPSSHGAMPVLPSAARFRKLPVPGSYALVVSTIEVRKNHLLLFRVWRQLLETMPEDKVPTLVFAGRIGWLVDDLMRQIDNTDCLSGKLVIIESPTDQELGALYGGCRFTLFPSFHEGWGLPVTESLALGKPCLISNRTSLPEAGGSLARTFDPDNLNDAYAAIRRVIEDPVDLARWTEQVRRNFEPVPWSATVDALLDGLGLDDMAAARLRAAAD